MALAESSGNPLPPSYTDNQDRIVSDRGNENPSSELPAYSQSQRPETAPRPIVQREEKEFDYKIPMGGQASLVITLITGSHSQNTPIFFEGSPVKGKIQLRLKKPEPISSVFLRVKGIILTGCTWDYDHRRLFLNQKHIVWSQEASQDSATLKGDHTWPFSIDLPREVEMPEGVQQQSKMFQLPQTFNQHFAHVLTIKYEIFVKVERKKGVLSLDDQLAARFGYIPIVRPPPLPPLRRLAYQEGTPLLGPKVDPDGWYLQKSVQIEGTLFNGRSARVECRLFLAKPLSYTRGSVIPLYMTLESDDRQVLDLLSSPKVISARVRRHVKYNSEPEKPFELKSLRDEIDQSQRAVWWTATEYSGLSPPDRLMMFNGELHLKPGMVPTSAMGNYSVNYTVVLLPFNTPGFKVDESAIFLEQPITVVTAFAPGPRPRMSTPADYTPDLKKRFY